jgi:hypothetical protein
VCVHPGEQQPAGPVPSLNRYETSEPKYRLIDMWQKGRNIDRPWNLEEYLLLWTLEEYLFN